MTNGVATPVQPPVQKPKIAAAVQNAPKAQQSLPAPVAAIKPKTNCEVNNGPSTSSASQNNPFKKTPNEVVKISGTSSNLSPFPISAMPQFKPPQKKITPSPMTDQTKPVVINPVKFDQPPGKLLANKPIAPPIQPSQTEVKQVVTSLQKAQGPIAVPYCEIPRPNSEVIISEVISGKHVFVRPADAELDTEYANTLAAVAVYAVTAAKPLTEMPTVGQVVLARNPERLSNLRRAMVLKTVGAKLIVAFIDFGAMATIDLESNCFDLSVELQVLRRLVHRCTVDVEGSPEQALLQLNTAKGSILVMDYVPPFSGTTLVSLRTKQTGMMITRGS